MPIPAQRTIVPSLVRNFGHTGDTSEVPPLCDIQVHSYERFLQFDTPPDKRTPTGLEGVLREIFPIDSYEKSPGKKLSLEYLRYELGKPRYGPDECRQLRLTDRKLAAHLYSWYLSTAAPSRTARASSVSTASDEYSVTRYDAIPDRLMPVNRTDRPGACSPTRPGW